MGNEAPTFGRQAHHLSHPHPGGGAGTQEAPTTKTNMHH